MRRRARRSQPLAPGERPPALLAAVALATALGLGNAIAFAAGATIGGKHPGPGVLAFSGLMALLAGGMFARRYVAVLAFEALLGLAVAFFSLFLIESANVLALVRVRRRDRRRRAAVLEARAGDGAARHAAAGAQSSSG